MQKTNTTKAKVIRLSEVAQKQLDIPKTEELRNVNRKEMYDIIIALLGANDTMYEYTQVLSQYCEFTRREIEEIMLNPQDAQSHIEDMVKKNHDMNRKGVKLKQNLNG